jgi:hypothetical protein
MLEEIAIAEVATTLALLAPVVVVEVAAAKANDGSIDMIDENKRLYPI